MEAAAASDATVATHIGQPYRSGDSRYKRQVVRLYHPAHDRLEGEQVQPSDEP